MNLFNRKTSEPALMIPNPANLEPANKGGSTLLSTGGNERFDIPDYSLARHQSKAYQFSPAVAKAVGIPSRYAAAQEFQVFQLVMEEKNAIPNHPFETLMKNPNPVMSQFQIFEATFAFLLLTGNAYWWFFGGSGAMSEPREIYLLPPDRIKPVPGNDIGTISHYEWDSGLGAVAQVPPEEIVHFKEFHSSNMWVGLGRTESAATGIERYDKAARYDLAFYGRDNAKPESIMNIKGNLSEADMSMLRDRFTRRHGGTQRSVAILSDMEGIDYHQLALNYADMDYIANMQFGKDDILDHYCPGLASVLAVNSTEANARTGKATMMEFGIWPMLVNVHQTITKQVLPLYGNNLIAEFDDIRVTDMTMELAEIDKKQQTLTIDEIRQEVWNLQPLGDDRGKLLVAQISPITTFGGEEPAAPQTPIAASAAQSLGQAPGSAETGAQGVVEASKAEVVDPPAPPNPMHSEIKQYIRHVKKSIKAGKAYKTLEAFNTEHIGAALKAAIAGALDTTEDTESMVDVLEGVVANA